MGGAVSEKGGGGYMYRGVNGDEKTEIKGKSLYNIKFCCVLEIFFLVEGISIM